MSYRHVLALHAISCRPSMIYGPSVASYDLFHRISRRIAYVYLLDTGIRIWRRIANIHMDSACLCNVWYILGLHERTTGKGVHSKKLSDSLYKVLLHCVRQQEPYERAISCTSELETVQGNTWEGCTSSATSANIFEGKRWFSMHSSMHALPEVVKCMKTIGFLGRRWQTFWKMCTPPTHFPGRRESVLKNEELLIF